MAAGRLLTAQWRNLLMMNFVVDPALVAPLVPAGTEPDRHGGATYVSLVAFQFLETRLLGVRVPWHHSFEELNLRFYVRRVDREGVRRAVVFVREVVPRRAIAFLARALYNEPYIALPMRHRVRGDPPAVEYAWRIGGTWHAVAAQALGEATVPDPASHAAFITEHSWGYTRQRNGRTLEYRVDHPSWRVWRARASRLPDGLDTLYGPAFAAALREPASVLVAEGSPVSVFRGELLRPVPSGA